MKFGPYVLESRLAVGGTSEVYLARPTDPRAEPQKLVIKRLLPEFLSDVEGRNMFEREAKLHACIHHENVVAVYAAGENDDGEPYLAMEFVDGLDGHRLLRKLKHIGMNVPIPIAIHIAREILSALASVHTARDENGQPLEIVHRDVTPSNVYLGRDGSVKLGDFGIARETARSDVRSAASAMLKGKFAYLAPEQVASEPSDHRADLFSTASVAVELILGEPLFPGAGQLAVLLAIRDCKLDALHALKPKLPEGLYAILLRALARKPDDRFPSAHDLAGALIPFAPPTAMGRAQLSHIVGQAMAYRSGDAMAAVRESSAKMRAAQKQDLPEDDPVTLSRQGEERKTGEYSTAPTFVRTRDNRQLGPWTFARLVEAIATGEVGRGDDVNYTNRGFAKLEAIEDLHRFLPTVTPVTNPVQGPLSADAFYDLAKTSMLHVLLQVVERNDTGVLFVERAAEESTRKELYFVRGRLQHVASSDASELLGEYIARRGKLTRDELDMALAMLPRYHGRMGDTLIGLGLVSPVDVFNAIREQGRDRVADIFLWANGRATFYRDQAAQRVDFPLDLDGASLLLAGMEAALPGDAAVERYKTRLHATVGPGRRDRPGLLHVKWPPQIAAIEVFVRRPRRLSELLAEAARSAKATPGSVLRAVEVLVAAHLAAIE